MMSRGEGHNSVWDEMLAGRCRPKAAPDIKLPGLYALFLTRGRVLGKIEPADEGLLYIGMTDSSLEARNHFRHKSSGFSTLRRTLGAILRTDLGLVPIPRSPGSSGSHFKFESDGEERLTEWMATHVDYAFLAVADDRRRIEAQLILDQQPPLNLTGWKNPQSQFIKALRALCR